MAALKTTFKRPLAHHVIIVGYVLAPVVNIVLLRVFLDIPFSQILERLFRGYGYLMGIWLLTAPLVGIGLYMLHRWSWYVFLAHSAVLLVDFVTKWVSRFSYYAETVPSLHILLLSAGNLALVIAIGILIQHDFRAPYFQVLQRSFREHKRVPMRHTILLDGTRRNIDDLSAGGCSVSEPDLGLSPGDHVQLELSTGIKTTPFQCEGEVMRAGPGGYGIRFIGLTGVQRGDITRLIKNRYALRYEVDFAANLTARDQSRPVRVLDISNGGCFVAGNEIAGMATGDRCRMDVQINGVEPTLVGRVAWINSEPAFGKPVGFGVQFVRKERRLLRHIVHQMDVRTLTR